MAISKKFKDKLDGLSKEFSYNATDTKFITSGSIIADAVISKGKGLPLGKYIEVASDSGLGKSTFVLGACKQACKQGKVCIYIDVEGGVNENQLEGIGLTPYLGEFFFLYHVQTFGQAEELLLSVLGEEGLAYIVIDSITALLPDDLLEKSIKDVLPGLQSRYASNFLQKFKGYITGSETSLIYINQIRNKFNFRGQTTQDSAGGYAMKFYQDIRIFFRKVGKLEKKMDTIDGTKTIEYGSEVAVYTKKNRYNSPFIEGTMSIIYGRGVSNLSAYTSWLKQNDIIKGKGWYTITFKDYEPTKVQGSNGILKWIKTNIKEVRQYIEENGGFQLIQGEKSDDDE